MTSEPTDAAPAGVDEGRLRELAGKATPGPWESSQLDHVSEVACSGLVPVISWQGFDDADRTKESHRANADFIAACREAVPVLLDRLAAVRAERDTAEAAVATARHGASGLCCQLREQEKARADAAERDRDALVPAAVKWCEQHDAAKSVSVFKTCKAGCPYPTAKAVIDRLAADAGR